MADTEARTQINDAGGAAGGDVAGTAAEAVKDTAQAGIEAEQKSFSAASDASRQSAAAIGRAAQTSLKAGQEMARQGQDMAKRTAGQAADFWRSSLTPMSQLTGEFNRWFEQMWRGAGGVSGMPLAMMAPFTGHPLADLRETDRGYELCVDLPGLRPQDVQLSIRGDMLYVSAEKVQEQDQGQGAYRFSERRFGRIERGFALPAGADRNNIEATLQDGVLKIAIPAAPEAAQAQTIQVRG